MRKNGKKIHDEEYHSDFLSVYECALCDVTSLRSSNIIQHYVLKHPEHEKPTVDQIVMKKVKNTNQPKRKLSQSKTNKSKSKACQFCGSVFKNGTKHLNVHLKRCHKFTATKESTECT